MKTLDDAVIELGGVLPDVSNGCNGAGKFVVMKMPISRNDKSVGIFFDDEGDLLFTGSGKDFQQRAKELGFINGYRWGIEYKPEWRRPDLPDDVIVQFHHLTLGEKPAGILHFPSLHWWKITDERYKPADTSYLEKPALEPVPEEESWWDYENDRPAYHGALPPAGEKVQLKHKQAEQGIAELISCRDDEVVWWNVGGGRFQHDKARHYEFKPLDHERKAKADRKKFIDSGCNITDHLRGVFTSDKAAHDVLCALYDAGFRLPE